MNGKKDLNEMEFALLEEFAKRIVIFPVQIFPKTLDNNTKFILRQALETLLRRKYVGVVGQHKEYFLEKEGMLFFEKHSSKKKTQMTVTWPMKTIASKIQSKHINPVERVFRR